MVYCKQETTHDKKRNPALCAIMLNPFRAKVLYTGPARTSSSALFARVEVLETKAAYG